MERNGWILIILEVKLAGHPDGLDVESEENRNLKMIPGCLN